MIRIINAGFRGYRVKDTEVAASFLITEKSSQIRNGEDPGGKYSYSGIGITHLVFNLLVTYIELRSLLSH